LIAILAAQVRRLSTHPAEALYVPADTRVRRRLLDMTVIYGEGEEATVPLTQGHRHQHRDDHVRLGRL